MKSVDLKAYPRTSVRRDAVKKVRSAGRIPAVIYGAHLDTTSSLEVVEKDFEKLLKQSVSENLLVDLAVDGAGTHLALVQDVQHHPLSGKVLHIDFHDVSPTEKVSVQVPVETTGEAIGVKRDGGKLEHVVFKLKVRALPKDLPEFLQIDVTEMSAGDTIHVHELKLPEGVEVMANPGIPVVSVIKPRGKTEAEVEAEAAAATAEKGKKK